MVNPPYHRLFCHSDLDDPFNHALRRQMFDNIPDTIFVTEALEIKIDLSLVNDFKTLGDLENFLNQRRDQVPPWISDYRSDLRRFQRKMLSICDYLYNINGLGSLQLMSEQYYKLSQRRIQDFVRKKA